MQTPKILSGWKITDKKNKVAQNDQKYILVEVNLEKKPQISGVYKHPDRWTDGLVRR